MAVQEAAPQQDYDEPGEGQIQPPAAGKGKQRVTDRRPSFRSEGASDSQFDIADWGFLWCLGWTLWNSAASFGTPGLGCEGFVPGPGEWSIRRRFWSYSLRSGSL